MTSLRHVLSSTLFIDELRSAKVWLNGLYVSLDFNGFDLLGYSVAEQAMKQRDDQFQSLSLSAWQTKANTFANSVDPDETARNEPKI